MTKIWKVQNHNITRESSEDKRTLKTTKKLLKQLDEFKPSEVAKKLKISVQKWTAIKKDIKAGNIYGRKNNAKLNSVLFNERVKHLKDKPTKKEIKKLKEQELSAAEKKRARATLKELQENEKLKRKAKKPKREKLKPSKKKKRILKRKTAAQEDKSGAIVFNSHRTLKGKVRHAKIVKTISSKKQATEWWKGIGGGSAYFVISKGKSQKTGADLWHVVDIRTQKELSRKNKGHLDGEARARQLVLDMTAQRDNEEDEGFYDGLFDDEEEEEE